MNPPRTCAHREMLGSCFFSKVLTNQSQIVIVKEPKTPTLAQFWSRLMYTMIPITNILYQTFKTCHNCTLELTHLIIENLKQIIKVFIVAFIVFSIVTSLGYYRLAIWCLRWIGLGILSSVGFGFGMHTFVLFLAPHIAAVTMAAHSCNSLDFPSPPYPKEIICPDTYNQQITFINIVHKVALESFMWGLGTAIGELPPYLAARLRAKSTVRITSAGDSIRGYEVEDGTAMAGWEQWMINLIHKIGFFGILLCAAIPNPLFDAAGVASGIAQVPFATFFGATFIGKAIVKVLIQSSFVIFLFHNNNLDLVIAKLDKRLCECIPSLKGLNLHRSLNSFLEQQRTNVLKKSIDEPPQATLFGTIFDWVICAIMLLFVVSVIRNLDQQYRRRNSSRARRTE